MIRPRDVLRAWNEFWFDPVETSSLAVFRIVFGVILLAWSISLLPGLYQLFTRQGIVPKQPSYTGPVWGGWGLLGIYPSKGFLIGLMVALIVASVFILIGFYSQLAALVAFLAILSLERRNPFVFNSGDVLIRAIAFYLIFAPADAALSVRSFLRNRRDFWTFPLRSRWGLRLLQVQVSIVYLVAVWSKARGTMWNDGTAVSYAFRLKDLERFPLPHQILNSLFISNVMTFGTLAIELSLAVLIWNRKLRPWVLLAGLSLHLGIDYSIRVGFYSIAIVSMYLTFVSPATMTSLVLAVRERLSRSRIVPLRRFAAVGGSPSPAS